MENPMEALLLKLIDDAEPSKDDVKAVQGQFHFGETLIAGAVRKGPVANTYELTTAGMENDPNTGRPTGKPLLIRSYFAATTLTRIDVVAEAPAIIAPPPGKLLGLR